MRSLFAFVLVCALCVDGWAQSNSWIPNLPPPDVYAGVDLEPYRARVSKFPSGRAFGALTLGLNLEQKFISADSWQMPGVGSSFDPLATQGFTAISLRVGGLLFQGRAEIYAAVPLLRLATRYGEAGGRDIQVGHFDIGGRFFPWAISEGKLRPFVSLGFSQRRMSLSEGGDSGSDVRQLNAWTLPIGIGAAFLTRFGLMVDVHAQYVIGDTGTLWTGVDSVSLEETRTDFPKQEIDAGGFRLSLGLRWVKPLWAGTGSENYVEDVAKRLYDLKRGGVLSDLTVSLGLAMPLALGTGNYMDAFRPYLAEAFSGGPTPQLAVGWHHDPLDIEARLSFRYKYASASGYGSGLETSAAGTFLEVFKKFDLGLYGLVPWVGLGVGFQSVSATDRFGGGENTYNDNGVTLSIPFGVDFRLDPSSAWFLRSGFRWIPSHEQKLADGANVNHGGFEVEFISVVIHPRRLMQQIRGIEKPKSAVEQALSGGEEEQGKSPEAGGETQGEDKAQQPQSPATESADKPAKPADAKPADANPADAKPAEAKSADAKPVDAKPAKATEGDAPAAEAKPSAETKPATKPKAAEDKKPDPAKAPPADEAKPAPKAAKKK